MEFKIIDAIRKRSRQQYQQIVRDRWIAFRIWVQEHGEKAALVSFVAALIFVLLFKLIVILLVILFIAAFAIWLTARPEGYEQEQQAGSPGSPE